MSAEEIINQIKKDSQTEIKQIQKGTENQIKTLVGNAKQEAEVEAEKILGNGKKQSESIKKILVSKASQAVKGDLLKAKEKIIEECFVKAHHELSILPETKYRAIVTMLMKDGKQKLGRNCTVLVCRDVDKKIAEELGLPISGNIETCGGIKIKSTDGRVILDYTFDGILHREKDKIRIKVGKLLFS